MKKNHWIILIIALILSGSGGVLVSIYFHHEKAVLPPNVAERIYHYPMSFVEQIKNDPNAGEKVFEAYCQTCHGLSAAVDVGAPIIGDKKAWMLRKKVGMKALLQITIQGAGAMPARGGCFECRDEDVKKAIQYILNKSTT